MSVSIDNDNLEKSGRNWIYCGKGTFSTTDTTVLVNVPFKTIQSAVVSYNGTVALADGPISITTSVSSGTLTVARIAGTTSGAAFSFIIKGR